MIFQTKKTTILNVPLPPITALVFEGGGIKGLAYAGVLEVLAEKDLLKDVKWVAGSSAGAMTGLLVALGYTQAQITAELKSIDFSKFKDHEPSWFGTVGQTINGIRNLFGLKRGYYRGEKLYNWVKKILKDRLGNEMATFNDLHVKATEDSKFKDLFVTTTSLSRKKTKIFSYERRGEAPIADILLASMSIPLFFQTRYMDSNYRIDWNPTRKKIKSGDLRAYIDGGFLNNDPIGIFQDRKYWSPGYWNLVEGKAINPSALNIRIDSNEEINALWGNPNNPIIAFVTWMKNLFETAMSDTNKSNDYLATTMIVPNGNIGTTKFCLSSKDKEQLIESGKNTTKDYIKQTREGMFYRRLMNNQPIDKEQVAVPELRYGAMRSRGPG